MLRWVIVEVGHAIALHISTVFSDQYRLLGATDQGDVVDRAALVLLHLLPPSPHVLGPS